MSAARDPFKRLLAERIDKVLLADLSFFERRPARRHRLRVASQAEIESQNLGRCLPGRQWFTIVRWLSAGRLHCICVENHAGTDVDIPEVIAAWVFADTLGKTQG